MLYSKKEVMAALDQINDDALLTVLGLRDGKDTVVDTITTGESAKRNFGQLDFICNGGQDLSEFYITVRRGMVDYTVQIREFEPSDELDFF